MGMRLEPCAALAVLLALSACGGSGNKNEAKPDQNGAAASASAGAGSASIGLNPGEWEKTVEVKVSGPGIPAQANGVGESKTDRECITPEEARKPTSDVFGGKDHGDCKHSEFSAEGGVIHAVMTCKGAGGNGTITITADGSYGGDNFDLRSKMTSDAAGAQMKMESHIVGKRVGDTCTDSGE
jgi:hypothetical protein